LFKSKDEFKIFITVCVNFNKLKKGESNSMKIVFKAILFKIQTRLSFELEHSINYRYFAFVTGLRDRLNMFKIILVSIC
jgi:hypothetical protein